MICPKVPNQRKCPFGEEGGREMRKIGGREGEILRKYLDGRELSSEDERIVRQLSRTGLIHMGFSIGKKKRTAKTSELGCRGI